HGRPTPYFFSLFFFHDSRPLRLLHSFPTRRSSDLPGHGRRLPDGAALHLLEHELHRGHGHEGQPHGSGLGHLPRRDEHRPGPSRSEEHTSELQSLRHLVCRLLLEKKKKKKNKHEYT